MRIFWAYGVQLREKMGATAGLVVGGCAALFNF